MNTSSDFTLYANTGVQYLGFPIQATGTLPPDEGWHQCWSKQDGTVRPFHYIQWRLQRSGKGDRILVLAVDTSLGPGRQSEGYFDAEDFFDDDREVLIQGLCDEDGEAVSGLAETELRFTIRPAFRRGNAIPVHLVLDFGNNRSGALLLEFEDEKPTMARFELHSRYRLEWVTDHADTTEQGPSWYSSKTHWCTTPLLPAPTVSRVEQQRVVSTNQKRRSLFGKRDSNEDYIRKEVREEPCTFQDLSMARLGQEVDDLALLTNSDVTTGLSSPKRYLWADDDLWLDGDVWHMFDPFNESGTSDCVAPLHGPLLRYLPSHEQDDSRTTDPRNPRHAPRRMMAAALYEILCQAFTFANSPRYRNQVGRTERVREIHSLVLTYPSGMIKEEKEVFMVEATRAAKMFHDTLGRPQTRVPSVRLGVDEASAVHISYLWVEMEKIGQKTSFLFQTKGRSRVSAASGEDDSDATQQPEQIVSRPAGRRITRRFEERRRRGDGPKATDKELRIASIDMGGGTTDIMIARYTFEPKRGHDVIRGEVIYRDGVGWAGDELVKALLQEIIVPELADRNSLDEEAVQFLFGEESRDNRVYRAQRVSWMTRMLVPLAETYLKAAVEMGAEDNRDRDISHTDPDIVSQDVVEILENTIKAKFGADTPYYIREPLGLRYDESDLKDIVHNVFFDLLYELCEKIVEHEADIVLLAGQPTKLKCIQEMVQAFLPLNRSRIIPMHDYYAGRRYPFASTRGSNRGRIVDPKSAVVVGAAIEHAIHHLGKGGQGFIFEIDFHVDSNTYYWGVMLNDQRIDDNRILFEKDKGPNDLDLPLEIRRDRTIIGRRIGDRPEAQASPIYLLRVDCGGRQGRIEFDARIRRVRPSKKDEEKLQLVSVEGTVAGEPAELGKNVFWSWCTLVGQRSFLDIGELSNINTFGLP